LGRDPFYRTRFWQQGEEPVLRTYFDHKIESQVVDQIFDGIKTKNTIFLDPSTVVCEAFCQFVVAGRHVYRDRYHVTPQGSFLLEPQLYDILRELR
jgi:hypothetical protein